MFALHPEVIFVDIIDRADQVALKRFLANFVLDFALELDDVYALIANRSPEEKQAFDERLLKMIKEV